MKLLKLVGGLLEYPDPALWAHRAELLDAADEAALSPQRRVQLAEFIRDLLAREPLEAQERWLLLFDRGRAMSLLLFERNHGESRDRGQAMVSLGVAGFAAAAGRHAGRLWRLGVLAHGLYALLFGYVHGWLFDDFFPWATRDLTVERTAFLVRVGLYLAFGALLVALNIVVDYARFRLVVEDRHSAVMALVAAARFVRRRPGPGLLLYLLNGFGFLLLLRVYATIAPSGGSSGAGFWLGVLVSQAYIVGRVLVKLQFYASQVTFFQGELAHAGYVAAPAAGPADPPAGEALRGAPAEPTPTRG